MKIEKDKNYRDHNDNIWHIVAADEGYFIGCWCGSKTIFDENGVEQVNTISKIRLVSEIQSGQRWINIFGWKRGSDSENGGSAPTTVHWWFEDADSSARMTLRENPNLILLAKKCVVWDEGDRK